MALDSNAGKRAATWLTICVGCVAGFEGLRQAAYIDPVGIPTICFGETEGVRLGDQKTAEECRQLLGERVKEFGDGVDSCVRVPLTPERKAAFTSMAYNVGVQAFCGSTLVRKANAGDWRGSCDEMLRWNRAGGVPWPGLTKRREAERELCMKGIA